MNSEQYSSTPSERAMDEKRGTPHSQRADEPTGLRVVECKIDWHYGWDNTPTLCVLVEQMPTLTWTRHADLFIGHDAEAEAWTQFAWRENGLRGGLDREIEIDGVLRRFSGCWSSRASMVARHLGRPMGMIHLTDDRASYERSGGHEYAVELKQFKALLRRAKGYPYGVAFLHDHGDGEVVYEPSLTEKFARKPDRFTVCRDDMDGYALLDNLRRETLAENLSLSTALRLRDHFNAPRLQIASVRRDDVLAVLKGGAR